MNLPIIYHIAAKADYERAVQQGYYVCESLKLEGFIHCSTRAELVNTANRVFRGKSNLILLGIDENKIASKVIYENLSGGAIQYPHIYGVLNLDAVLETYSFACNEKGEFSFPDANVAFDSKFNEQHFLLTLLQQFQKQRALAEKAMEQLDEAHFYSKASEESNNIALLIKHLSGNMISRWTDFLTSDGEKSNRNRDDEFIEKGETRAQLMEQWERGWKVFESTLHSLTVDDLAKVIYIRGEAHSVTQALLRQLSHYSNHVGQIVFIAKMIRDNQWKTLSIARGKSNEFKP